jgi:hypothetical protein
MTQPDVSQPWWPTVEGFGRCGVKAIAEPAAVERIRSSGSSAWARRVRAPYSVL